jgi:hypothetical protein
LVEKLATKRKEEAEKKGEQDESAETNLFKKQERCAMKKETGGEK